MPNSAFAPSQSLLPLRRCHHHTRACPRAPSPTTPTAATPVPLGPFPSVTPLALGTWSWGNRLLFDYSPAQDAALQHTFDAALARGVNLIDTADSYGTGALNARAELLLGKFLRESPLPTADVLVASKFASYPWRLSARSVADAAARSAHRLGRPVDLGQMHWSSRRYAPWQERALLDGLALARREGHVREVGVSNVGPQGLRRVEAYLRKQCGVRLATAQTQLSLLRRECVEDGFIGVAAELGVGVMGYSPLCLGLLSGKYGEDEMPRGARGLLFGRLLAGGGEVVGKLREVAERRGVTPAQVAVAWCLAQGVVVIVGAREVRHVEEGIAACDVVLGEDECAELEAAARRSPQMVRNAFQTS